MLKVKHMLGDKVVCVDAHYDNDKRLVRVNDTGYITQLHEEELEVVWQISDYPHTTVTRVSDSKVDPIR